MGNTSIEMLFRIYSQHVPSLTRQDGSAIERLLASRVSLTNALQDYRTASGGAQGFAATWTRPAEATAFVHSEVEKWGKVNE